MYMGKYQKANIKHHITNTANSTKTNIEVSVFQKFQFFFFKKRTVCSECKALFSHF